MNKINIVSLSLVLLFALITTNVYSASLNVNIQPLSIWGEEKPELPQMHQPAPVFIQVPVPATNATSNPSGPNTGILTNLLPGAIQNFTSQLPVVGSLKIPSLPLPGIPNLPSFNLPSILKRRALMEEYDGYEK